MHDAETQDLETGTPWNGGGGDQVKKNKNLRRNSTLMNNITKEAKQSHRLLSYPRKSASILAVLHIFIGAVCIACMSVHVWDCNEDCKAIFWRIGYGIWSGVLYIFTGSFGLWTTYHSFRGSVCYYGMLCVVTACESTLPFSFAVCDSVYSTYNASDPKKLWRVMIAIVAAFSLLEALLTIISASLCFHTLFRRGMKTSNNKNKKGTVDSGN